MSGRLFLTFVIIFLSTISVAVSVLGFLYGVAGWGFFLFVIGVGGLTIAFKSLPNILMEE